MSNHPGTHDVGKNAVFEYEGEGHQLVPCSGRNATLLLPHNHASLPDVCLGEAILQIILILQAAQHIPRKTSHQSKLGVSSYMPKETLVVRYVHLSLHHLGRSARANTTSIVRVHTHCGAKDKQHQASLRCLRNGFCYPTRKTPGRRSASQRLLPAPRSTWPGQCRSRSAGILSLGRDTQALHGCFKHRISELVCQSVECLTWVQTRDLQSSTPLDLTLHVMH